MKTLERLRFWGTTLLLLISFTKVLISLPMLYLKGSIIFAFISLIT